MLRTARSRARRTPVLATVAVTAALVLAACTGSHSSDTAATGASGPTTGTTSSPTPSAAAALSPDEAAAKILATPEPLPVLAQAHGTLDTVTENTKFVAQVLQIRATSTNTVVVWRLKSASGARVSASSFQLAYPPLMDTRLLGVVDTATHTTYRPYTYPPARGNGMDLDCTCSELPGEVGRAGEVMNAVVPPLPASVTTVDVTLPGFTRMKHVPVDRATP